MTSLIPPLRRSSCWKHIFRQRWQQSRNITSKEMIETHDPLPHPWKNLRISRSEPLMPPKHIKAYPPPPSAASKFPFPIDAVTAQHLTELDPTTARQRLFAKSNPDKPNVGDILLATFKSGDPFAGVCLSIKRRGVDTAVLLRNRIGMVGTEMWVKIFSPVVRGIEVVKRAEKRARRARLYYMRKEKHDRGSVEGVVEDYLRQRRLVRSGAVGVKDPKSTGGGKKGGKKVGVGAR